MGCPGWSWNEGLPYFVPSGLMTVVAMLITVALVNFRLSWVKDLHGTSEAFLKAAKQASGYHGRSGQAGEQWNDHQSS